MKSARAGLSCLFLAVLIPLGACRHYQVDPIGEKRGLKIAPILNETDLPHLIAPLSRTLREAISHDPRWTLVRPEDTAPTLHVRLLSDSRSVISRDPTDTGRPLSITQTISAEFWWEKEPDSTDTFSMRRIEVEGMLYTQPGLLASQDGLLAELADQLAREILVAINTDREPR
ncbi:MAG: hypothetical protein RL648_989 [Verrucomicrobiota bacterium]|jgi:hypothetical protein